MVFTFNFYGDTDNDGILNRDDPDVNGDGIVDNSLVPVSPEEDTDEDGNLDINDGDIDGDLVNNADDPDVNGDDVVDNPLVQDPVGDIDGDGIPNIDDPDIDGDGIPNGDDGDIDGDGVEEEINAQMCNGIRINNKFDNDFFAPDFNWNDCSGFAEDSCEHEGLFLWRNLWTQQFGCCTWDCVAELPENDGGDEGADEDLADLETCGLLADQNNREYSEHTPDLNAAECSAYATEMCNSRGEEQAKDILWGEASGCCVYNCYTELSSEQICEEDAGVRDFQFGDYSETLNADTCSTYAVMKCALENQRVTNSSWVSNDKCCIWNCKDVNQAAVQKCEEDRIANGRKYAYYDDAFTPDKCLNDFFRDYCDDLGLYSGAGGFIGADKCCVFDCNTAEQQCALQATGGNYEFHAQDDTIQSSAQCVVHANASCNATGKVSSKSLHTISPTCCTWSCKVTESHSCTDNDNALGFPNYLKTKSTCVDDFGTHEDYCSAVGWVTDWYCFEGDGQRYCYNSTSTLCSTEFAGTTCSNGACI